MIVRGHSRMKKSVSTTGFIRTMDRSCTAGLCSSLRAPGKMSVWQVLPATVQSLELASWQIDWLCFKVSRHLTDNVVNNVANSWSPAVRHPLGRLSSYAGGNMWELSWDAQPGMGLMCAKISGGMENTRTPSNSPASLVPGAPGKHFAPGAVASSLALAQWPTRAARVFSLTWCESLSLMAGSYDRWLCFSTKTHKVRCCVPWKAVPSVRPKCLLLNNQKPSKACWGMKNA